MPRTMYRDQGQDIDENDFMGGLGFNLFKTYLSATITKSLYDQEFNGTSLNLDAHRFNVGFAPTILPGYPDVSYTAGVDQSLWPGWWLLGSLTHVKYKAGPDDQADFFSAGAGVKLLHYIRLSAIYTRYAPMNNPNQNFVTVAARLQF